MRLRTKTGLLMATTVAFALGTISLLYLQFLEKSIRSSINQGMVGVSETVAELAARFLAGGLADAGAVAAFLDPAAIATRNAAAVETAFKTMAAIYPQFDNGFFILDAAGTLWADYPAVNLLRQQSYADHPAFKQAMAQNKGVVALPYRSPRTGKPVVTFTALLRDDKGRVIGLLGCSTSLLSPDALGGIRRTSIGVTGHVSILDTSRQMILHPRAERILVRDVPEGIDPLLDAAINGFEGLGRSVASGGEAMLVAVKRVAGVNWIVFARQPESEAFAPLADARRRVVLGIFVAAALAAGFGIVAVRWITSPLQSLQAAALHLGTPGARDRLEGIASKDEIGDLARTVATISGRLTETLASLEQASLLWQRTFNAVADPVLILYPSFRIQRINQAAAEWVGMTPDQAIGQAAVPLIYARPFPPYNCPHTETIGSGRMTRVVMDDLRPGRVHELTATALTDEKGRISGTVLIVRDITAQQRAELALRESEESFRDIVENSVDSIFSVDLQGRIIACNRATCTSMGYDQNRFIGSHYKDLMDPPMAEKAMAAFNGVFVSGQPLRDVLFDVRRKDGRPMAVRGNVRLLVKSGKPAGFQVIMRDVTQQQRLDAQLQRAEKLEAIGTLAGGIAHDFNNILAAMMGYLNLARLNADNPADITRYLQSAETAVTRASGLTRQLLTFSKGGEPVRELLAIAPLVDEAVSIALGQASACSHEIAIAADLKPVLADRDQIMQVLTNLLINARQAMSDGGRIRIEGRNRSIGAKGEVGSLESGDYVVVRVQDQGQGITEAIRERIFDPFFTTKKGGSGLGLATSHSIITRHGGHIEAGAAAGGGAVFSFYLPAHRKNHSRSAS